MKIVEFAKVWWRSTLNDWNQVSENTKNLINNTLKSKKTKPVNQSKDEYKE